MDAPAEISQQIEGRLICPVNVFEDDGGGRSPAADRCRKPGEHLMPGSSAGEERLELAAKVGRHIEQRAKGSRACQGLRTSPTGTWLSDPRAQRVLRRATSFQRPLRPRSRRPALARGRQTRPGTAYRMSHPVPAAGLRTLLARGIAPVPVRRVIANQGSRSEGSGTHKMGERPRCPHLIVGHVGAGLSAFARPNSGALRRDLAGALAEAGSPPGGA